MWDCKILNSILFRMTKNASLLLVSPVNFIQAEAFGLVFIFHLSNLGW